MPKYHLVSSVTCPWVQRAVITLRAKAVAFDVTYVDLRNKPDWFLEISPHGKVPVLQVDGHALFESNAIAEFLDEQVTPRLHPEDAIKRARNRAWTDFVPDFAKALSSIYWAKTIEDQQAALAAAPRRLDRVEEAIRRERGNDGPYFNGERLSLVDAAYAPFLQRFTLFDQRAGTGLLDAFPLIRGWRDTLLADEVVTGSVAANFLVEFAKSFRRHESVSAPLFEAEVQAAE